MPPSSRRVLEAEAAARPRRVAHLQSAAVVAGFAGVPAVAVAGVVPAGAVAAEVAGSRPAVMAAPTVVPGAVGG